MNESARLEKDADDLCERADEALFDDRPNEGNALGRKAWRLYRDAARLAGEPDRSRLLVRAVEVAGAVEDHKAVVALVREACQADPTFDQVETLKDHWECSGWVAARGADPLPFPELAPAGSKTLPDRKAPLPGQGELFPVASEAPHADPA